MLEMATSADVTDSESLACPTCFEPFKSPRDLPCLHTVCEKCLDSHIKSQVKGGSQFMCPICETTTVPPDTKLTLDKRSVAFPLNNIITYMMDASKENTDEFCQPCKVDGDTNTAEFWCIDCQEQLCSSCKRSHNRMKMLRHQVVVSIDERQEGQKPNVQLNFIQDCTRHRGQRLELYCTDHRELCCVVCFASSHRQCDNVRGITDVADEQGRTLGFVNVIKDVVEIQIELNKLLTDRSNSTRRLEQEKKEMLRDMDAIVDKIIAKLNEQRQIFRNDTERRHIDTKNSLLVNNTRLRCFLKNLENSKRILDRIEQITSAGQKFVLYENFRSQIMSHYQQLKSQIQNDKDEIHFTLKPNSVLLDLDSALSSLGKVEITSKTSAVMIDTLKKVGDAMKNLNMRTKVSTVMCVAQVEKVDLMTSPVTFVTSVTRDFFGKDTYFTGGTYLKGGRFIMADRNNNRLVELDNDYKVVKKYKVDGYPTDVATLDKNKELYMAVNENSVYKCTLDTKLTVISRIKAPTNTWGIAVTDDNIIVSTDSSVVVMTQDGIRVKFIPIQTDGYYTCTAMSPTQRTFYHRDGDAVVCRTLERVEKFRYTHQLLDLPLGMCTDTHNNLYVCGLLSRNIHQISTDGKRGRILLNKLHNISTPYSVVFNPQKNELVVISCNEHTVFEVYKLS